MSTTVSDLDRFLEELINPSPWGCDHYSLPHAKVNLKPYKNQDKPGFRLETMTKSGAYKVETYRLDGSDGSFNYNTLVWDYAAPRGCMQAFLDSPDAISHSATSPTIERAVQFHFDMLMYLEEKGRVKSSHPHRRKNLCSKL